MNDTIRQAATAGLEAKIAAGEHLDAALQAVAVAEAVATEARKEVASARRKALAAGWSERELKRLGLAPTTRRAKTKPAPAKLDHDARPEWSEVAAWEDHRAGTEDAAATA